MDTVTYRLAHLTDPHLSTLEPMPWRALPGKRVMGYLSWRFNRKRVHRPERLAEITRDIQQAGVDHWLITGDLTHIGLPHEFAQARQWLSSLGPPGDISVVPGNHDAYGRPAHAAVMRPWREWMGDEDGNADALWPTVRRRAAGGTQVAIIGVSSAVISPPGHASGRVGHAQVARLGELLDAHRDAARIVLVHHSPVPGHDRPRKRLIDGVDMLACLQSHGAELLLHGHGHRSYVYHVPLRGRPVPFMSVASASSTLPDVIRRAAWQLLTVTRLDNGGHRIELERRSFDPTAGRVVAQHHGVVSAPA